MDSKDMECTSLLVIPQPYSRNHNLIKNVFLQIKMIIFAGTKFLFDRLLAITGLVITLPLMLIIAIAIKLDSKGPVLFKQERTGKNGKNFKMYKFIFKS